METTKSKVKEKTNDSLNKSKTVLIRSTIFSVLA